MIYLTIPTPPDFDFMATVKSHGWYQLAPNKADLKRGYLRRPYRLEDGRLAQLCMQGSKSRSILVEVKGRAIMSSRDRNLITQAIRYMFNLEQNLKPFYAKMSKTTGYEWVTHKKTARLLASPTVWEDLVKTLLTTNTSWSNTLKMAENLSALDPDNIFPSAETLAKFSEDDLAEKAGLGYRGQYLYNLVQRVVSGELDVETWRYLNSADLYKAVTDLQGFGDYSAGTVLRLLGHFDKLAIDSVARNAYEHVTGHAPENDTDIRNYYEDFGEWRGLVLWMDCIRDDIEDAPLGVAK